jgi:hypothetical protein
MGFRPYQILLIFLASSLCANAADSTRPHSPAALRTIHQLDSLCAQENIDTTYLNALLVNLDDADLVQVSATDLFDDLKAALETREKFPWGRNLSQADFCRYVIPVRIDDEPLQRYRRWMMQKLAAAVKNCQTAEEAALEVNLWLGQRVTYQPTDWRDQGPLTTISCGFGRCGEETILLVAALRCVGLAARMVYVPFWAHCSDNHAWVEVRTETKWKYMGACEPDAALDRAWFDEPVLRAPVLLANVGEVDSTELGAVKGRRLWQLNTTENYMTPCHLKATFPKDWTAQDKLSLAVFNYGGIRPILRLEPSGGTPAVDIGIGDFVLLGLHNGKLFLQTITTHSGETLVVPADPAVGLPNEFTLCYPVPKRETRGPSSETWQWRLKMARSQLELAQKEKNEVPKWLADLAKPSDSTLSHFLGIFQKAPGNADVLRKGYEGKSRAEQRLFVELLDCLSEKDLREIDAATLKDYFDGAVHALSRFESKVDSLRKYVISPRIGWEPTRPWRLSLEEAMGKVPAGTFIERAKKVNALVAGKIGMMDGVRAVDPFTAWQAECISEKLAPALACGMLRIAGVPAHVTSGKEWVTFYNGEAWKPLYPAHPEQLGIAKDEEKTRDWFEKPATVRLTCPGSVGKVDFEETFDLVRLVDGWPDDRAEAILDYEIADSTATVKAVPGDYLLTWGLRNGRGDARVGERQIHLESGETHDEYLPLSRPPEAEVVVADTGTISVGIPFMADNDALALRDFMAAKPLLILVVAVNHEPSTHMEKMAQELVKEGHSILILSGQDEVTGYPEASKALLRSLKIPFAETDFRRGAPYYRYLLPDGRICLSGSGYQLNFKSDVEKAARQAR